MTEDNQNIIPRNKTRRSFLKKAWIGLGIVAGIEFVYLVGSFLLPNKKANKETSEELFNTGEIKNFRNNSITPFRNHKFFLSRTKDGGFLAISIRCSHLGCNVIWDKKNGNFICPCHSSWFDSLGDVMQPPATRPLAVHPVIIKNKQVLVNTKVVIKRNSIKDTQIVYASKKGTRA